MKNQPGVWRSVSPPLRRLDVCLKLVDCSRRDCESVESRIGQLISVVKSFQVKRFPRLFKVFFWGRLVDRGSARRAVPVLARPTQPWTHFGTHGCAIHHARYSTLNTKRGAQGEGERKRVNPKPNPGLFRFACAGFILPFLCLAGFSNN